MHTTLHSHRGFLKWKILSLILHLSPTGPCSDQRDPDDHLSGGGGGGASPGDRSAGWHHCCSHPGGAEGNHQGFWQWWAASVVPDKIPKLDASICPQFFKILHLIHPPSFSGLLQYRHPHAAAPPRTDRGGASLPLTAGLRSPSIWDSRSEDRPRFYNRWVTEQDMIIRHSYHKTHNLRAVLPPHSRHVLC